MPKSRENVKRRRLNIPKIYSFLRSLHIYTRSGAAPGAFLAEILSEYSARFVIIQSPAGDSGNRRNVGALAPK
jgi:hypothetical protein